MKLAKYFSSGIKHLAWGVLLTMLPLISFAQNPLHLIKTNNELEGLAQSINTVLYQDSKGFIWLGSFNGLIKYDGYELVVYQNDLEDPFSIDDNKITEIKEDLHGNIWVITQNGINKYDRKVDRFFRYQPIKSLKNESQTFLYGKIEIDHKGTVWVSTQTQLFYLEEGKSSFKLFDIPNEEDSWNRSYIKVFEDSQKHLWIITKKQILKFNPDRSHFEVVSPAFDSAKIISENRYDYVYNLIEDLNGNIWGLSSGLLWQYNLSSKKITSYSLLNQDGKNIFSSMVLGSDNNLLLIASDNIHQFNTSTKRIEPILLDSEIDLGTSIFKDDLGSYWIYSAGKIERYTTNTPFLNYKTNPTDQYNLAGYGGLYSYWEMNPGELVVPRGDSLVILEWRKGTWKSFPFQPNHLIKGWKQLKTSWKCINGFLKISDNKVWMSTSDNGVLVLDIDKGSFEHYNNNPNDPESLSGDFVRDIHMDSDGDIWIMTWNHGLNKFDAKTKKFTRYLSDVMNAQRTTRTMFQDSKGTIWFGTRGGLLRFNKATAKFKTYIKDENNPNSISNDTPFDICEGAEGYLWIGTFGGGLNRMDTEKETFKHYTTKNGLIHNNVFSVIPDKDGNLWLSTDEGISRFNPKTEIFQNFTHEDGLINRRFTAFAHYKSPFTGHHFYNGETGLDIFNPDDFQPDSTLPHIVLTDFEILNEKIEVARSAEQLNDKDTFFLANHISETETLTIPYDKKVITIKYAGLHFANPEKNKYAYQLIGFDKDWRYVGTERQATYTNLNSGTYTFRVKGSNADGVWNEKGTSIKIVVTPPWWQTWWAYGLYALLLGLVIWSYMQYQRRRWFMQTQLKMKEKEAIRLKDLDSMKSQLYANITHEFRTPLTVILGMSDEIPDYHRENATSKLSKGVLLIKRNTQKLLQLINQMLDLAKLEAGGISLNLVCDDVIGYLRYLTESYHSLAESKNIKMSFHSTPKTLEMDYDEERLYNIFSNLLSNATKFTGADGNIAVDISMVGEDPQRLCIQIKDSGIGIPASKLPHIFDRFYQVDGSTSRGSDGTGIGLALTKELVELFKGDIKVTSKVGEGTLFEVFLPITKNAPRKDNRQTYEFVESPAVGNVIEQGAFKNERTLDNTIELPSLLIVEDSPDIVHYLQSSLGGLYQITVANNGQEGIDKACEIVPDIIISDVMMPVKDGFELCDTLKNDERTSHIPIIILTAKATVEDRITGLRRGADAYLPKPFHKEELIVRLEKLIELRNKLQSRYTGILIPPTKEDPVLKIEDEFVLKAIKIIEDNLDDDTFGVQELADSIFLSRTQVHRKLKALTGKSVGLFIRSVRLHKAKEMLQQTSKSIKEIAYSVGFNDPAYFSRVFAEEFGNPPSFFSK